MALLNFVPFAKAGIKDVVVRDEWRLMNYISSTFANHIDIGASAERPMVWR